jgi:hypothetical protein
MKAYDKNRLTPKQRNAVTDAVLKEYHKIKEAHEKKLNDRIFFIHYLALAEVLSEVLHFGPERKARIIEACMDKANEISQELIKNKCIDADGRESFDSDYNRTLLARMAKQNNLKFDESIFDDDFEEVASELQTKQQNRNR